MRCFRPARWLSVACVAALCLLARSGHSAEHFGTLSRFSSGYISILYHGQYFSEGYSGAMFSGPANNNNSQYAATWTRIGARDAAQRAQVVESVGVRVVDGTTSQCFNAVINLARYRKAAVASPGALCSTYSGTYVGAAGVSYDTCLGGNVDRLYRSHDLALSYAAESSSTGLKAYGSSIYMYRLSYPYEEVEQLNEGCHVINWTSTPPICCSL